MEGRALRILVVSASVPFPPRQAPQARTWHLTTLLRQRHHLTLATWADPGAAGTDSGRVADAFDEVLSAPLAGPDRSLAARLRRRAAFYGGGPPPYALEMLDERTPGTASLREQIAERHRARPFDLVLLEEEALTIVPLADLGIPRMLQRLNFFSRAVGDIQLGSRLHRLLAPLDRRGWARFDRACSDAVDAVVATTPESAACMATVTRTPVRVVSNGVEIPACSLVPSEGTDLVFIGWMGYPPNVDAVTWFVDEVWPEIHRQRPGCRFRIVGRDPSPAVSALASCDVEVTGEVPDVVEACRGARAAVVPLRAGMGIKNKTLESMAMGLPVVATPAGGEGIGARDEDGLFVRERPGEISRCLLSLLTDGRAADRLGRRARQLVADRFSWAAAGRALLGAVDEMWGG